VICQLAANGRFDNHSKIADGSVARHADYTDWHSYGGTFVTPANRNPVVYSVSLVGGG
jgi:hypothetical protein